MQIKSFVNIAKLNQIFFYLFFAIFFIVYFLLLFAANTDLSAGKYVLFMDELLTFEGAEKIYHSTNLQEFYLNVVDGKDHRYGRIMWNLYALTSYIPYLIFGESGQIIATRFTQDLILFAAYLILVWSFLKSFYLRIAAFAILLCLPSTPYYSSMPKPEPIQLLFLALFLMFVLRDGFQKSRKWIFLGIAFGAKISILPYVLCLFLLNLLNFSFPQEIKNAVKNSAKNFGFFFLGLIIAVPVFLRGHVAIYIKSTFKNTGHGSDDASINVISWIKFLHDDYFYPIFWLIILIVAMLAIYYCYKFSKIRNLNFLKDEKLSLLLVGSFSLFLPIILKTHRLWGFYLHIAAALLFLALFVMIEETIKFGTGQLQNKIKAQFLALFYSILLFVVFVNFSIHSFNKYLELARRTDTAGYQEQKREHDFLKKFLLQTHQDKDRVISVLMDLSLFTINSSDDYKIAPIFSPMRQWDENYDVVIIYKNSLDFESIKETNEQYNEYLQARKTYLEHVILGGKKCLQELCYVEYTGHSLDKVKIFMKQK